MDPSLSVVTAAAIIDSFNPCAISVLLLTIGFLVHAQKKVIPIASTYILGIFATYILIGLGVLRALSFFGFPHVLSKFGAAILIITGFLGLLKVPLGLPAFIKPHLAKLIHTSTYPAMFTLGILVGLFEFPCTGGPYLLILTLLHDKSTLLQGALYLIYYNLIFVSPLVLILTLSTVNSQLSTKLQSWLKSETISSLAMIILGAIIFML
ncbi:hypothetical protein A2634_04260 [Candidatus Amesbacteria bacterium RIFCSPHIGHO2_01_FULL_48_32]|uniref:Uncharacterized protein n=1 Tax=Candidatus Amesbacteria bacterium RIFCSPLOWO2_01_FULL_48_25 TaxID=1797259 RepID=A0A1F4ZC56_9BACT|nr:MAG: hypothetical protein A2634_04260 [Candidatus Amesbacteria bacterium RIFCSPHIGHO2_01_FULL_48_32]OGD03882.1 MAG: hypothetical protein A2989_04245 [Candidatus Amesbacteria bacterium RIFCSPLOWO2_01_FULL_48_25]HJZ05454.1 cytochrome c biogenesis protein CcdA [Patescibacteria group bacterium]